MHTRRLFGILRSRNHLEDLGVDGSIKLQRSSVKYSCRVLTELICLRRETDCAVL